MIQSQDTLKINVASVLNGTPQAKRALQRVIEDTVDIYCKACKIKKSECTYHINPIIELVIENRKHISNQEVELNF